MYLLKASGIIVIFYCSYYLFLQKETFFQANRWFLLSGLFFALGLPLFIIPVYVETVAFDISDYPQLPIETIINIAPQTSVEQSVDIEQFLYWLYGLGVVFCTTKLFINLISLGCVFKSAQLQKTGQFIMYKTDKDIAPFSFFDRIIFNPNQFNKEDLEHIINHEKVHSRQLHSADIMIAHLVCIIFWFNPIVWFYKTTIQQNLEFIADSKTQELCTSSKSYQKLLLRTSVKQKQLAMTNTFFTSLIKKRIIIMHQSKSKNINRIKLFSTIPILVVFMMSFSTETVFVESVAKAEKPRLNSIQERDSLKVIFNKDMSDADLEKMKVKLSEVGVTFKYKRLKRNSTGEIIAIITEFSSKDNSGTYNISSSDPIEPFYFELTKNEFTVGKIKHKDKNSLVVSRISSTQSSKTKQRTVKNGNKETDTTIIGEPIVFKEIDTSSFNFRRSISNSMSKDGSGISIDASEHDNSTIRFPYNHKPYIIVDGEEAALDVLHILNPSTIESMEVIKGKNAVGIYGNKAKDGAIIVNTKNYLKVADSRTKDEIIVSRNLKGEFIVTQKDSNKLFIVDGQNVSKHIVNRINKHNIKSVEVINGAEAVEKFGAKASNGVIIIETNSRNQNPI